MKISFRNRMLFVQIPNVALFHIVWNRRVHHVLLNVWGHTPLFYRKELT